MKTQFIRARLAAHTYPYLEHHGGHPLFTKAALRHLLHPGDRATHYGVTRGRDSLQDVAEFITVDFSEKWSARFTLRQAYEVWGQCSITVLLPTDDGARKVWAIVEVRGIADDGSVEVVVR